MHRTHCTTTMSLLLPSLLLPPLLLHSEPSWRYPQTVLHHCSLLLLLMVASSLRRHAPVPLGSDTVARSCWSEYLGSMLSFAWNCKQMKKAAGPHQCELWYAYVTQAGRRWRSNNRGRAGQQR